MNSGIRVADHANPEEPAVVIIGEDSERETLASLLVAESATAGTRASKPSLSRREVQLLRFAIQGFTDAEIARRLCLAATTVKSQLRSTVAKLARHSRGAAAILDADQPVAGAVLAFSPADRARAPRG